MRRRAKRLTRQQILGETAVQFIGRCFLDIGLPWHPTNAPLDAGIDGFVEIRDVQSGEATNAWIAVQSKGRTTLEKETATSFEFTCTPRDLDYWRRGNMPVLLVVSRPERNEAWWVSVKDFDVRDRRADTIAVSERPLRLHSGITQEVAPNESQRGPNATTCNQFSESGLSIPNPKC
jgi:hypothetical protein